MMQLVGRGMLMVLKAVVWLVLAILRLALEALKIFLLLFGKELQRFHQLQDQYLFFVRNDIKSVESLVIYEYLEGDRAEQISARQKEIYKESGSRKRACKTEDDIRNFQIWYMQAQEELDALKAEKKEIRNNLKLVEGCK